MGRVSSPIPGDTNATRGNAPQTTRHSTGIPTPVICQDCGICNPGTCAKHTGPSSTWHGRAPGSGCTRSSGRGTVTPTSGDARDTGRPSDKHHGHDNSRRWWAGNYRTGQATGKQGRWGARTQDTSRGRASTCRIFRDRDILEKLGPSILNPETVLSMLQWQKDVNGDAARINAFKAKVGSLLTFQAFLMMQEGSAMVTVLHSLAKFFAITMATSRYQGQFIGFVGDRLPMREPGPVLIQATKGWEWVKKPIRANGDALMQAYAQPDMYGKLWSPPADSSKVEKAVSRLLAVPPIFLKLIREQNKSLMPHEVWSIVKAYLGSHGLPREVAAACKFAMDWCLPYYTQSKQYTA
jgi:hypothetical protein